VAAGLTHRLSGPPLAALAALTLGVPVSLLLVFWAAGEMPGGGCGGPPRDQLELMRWAHLLAAGILLGVLGVLTAFARLRPWLSRLARWGLVAGALYALACALVPIVFLPAAVVGLVVYAVSAGAVYLALSPVGLTALMLLALVWWLASRRGRVSLARPTGLGALLGWVATTELVLFLPGHYVAVYLQAPIFCF
jgi:hypothetical protein